MALADVKALKIEAARAGLAIADGNGSDWSGTDFRSTIARAERAHPEVYYVEALQPGLDLLGQQLSDAVIHNVSAVAAPSLSDKHVMPYAYDSVNMIVHAFERAQSPAVYLRNLRTDHGTAGVLTKGSGRGNSASVPAVWTIASGKPALLGQ